MTSNYWKERVEAEIKAKKALGKTLGQELEDLYTYHYKAIESDIDAFLNRYAEKNNIDTIEAKKRVDEFDVKAFEVKAKKYVEEKNFSSRANAELRLYNLRMKMKAHELLQYNLDLEMLALGEGERQLSERFLNQSYVAELHRQAGLLGHGVPDKKRIEQLAQASINANFHGVNWSDRVWKRQQELRQILQRDIESMLFRGRHPTKIVGRLRKEFDVSRFEAERLAVTEMARVSTEAQRNAYEEFGYDRYEFIAEPTACSICSGLDGKMFDVSEMMPGKNASPMHPHCHCTTGAVFDNGKTVENSINKVYNQGMNSSGAVYGAWNDKNDPDEVHRKAHAEKYYEAVRNRSTSNEVKRISSHTGLSESEVEAVYNHVFENYYPLEGGMKRFDPDYDMAQSWDRLFSGKNIQKHDIVLLKHELMESKLMASGMDYDSAHKITQKEYDYLAELIKWQIERGDL